MSGVRIPWWGKIGAKIVLSRLPFGHAVWQRMGLFRHGRMDASGYSLNVFRTHTRFAAMQNQLAGRTLMELGPGDGIATALISASYGARAVLLDTDAYARTEVASVLKLAAQLNQAGVRCPDVSACQTFDDVLRLCGAQYLTQGLQSMREIPDESVDLIFSQSVLEHVRKREFDETMRQCRRVLKVGGAFSNHVDLKDHLGGGLNNLRFTDRVWESDLFSKSGFYTNRIRLSDMLGRFEAAGFSNEMLEALRWKRPPIARTSLAQEFQMLSDEELMVSAFDVVLR